MHEHENSLRDHDHTYLLGKKWRRLKVVGEMRRNVGVKLRNYTLALSLVIDIALRVPWTKFTKVLRVGLAEVRWADPHLVENAE